MLANHSGPLQHDLRDVGVGFNVVIVGWLAPQAGLTAGKGGRGRGSPRLPSIEAIRAVSSPHTKAPAPWRTSRSKEKSGAEDIFSQEAKFARLLDGDIQVLYGHRIFGAAVNITALCADGVRGR